MLDKGTYLSKSTNERTSRSSRLPAVLRTHRSSQKTSRKSTVRSRSVKKVAIRYGLLAFNMLILGAVSYLIFAYSNEPAQTYGAQLNGEEKTVSNPLDALSAADIAVNVAKMTGLQEELAVINQAEEIDAHLDTAFIEKEYVAKAQIMSSEIKTKEDIAEHVVAQGETVAALATRYGVTSDSIKWSNDLTGDRLKAGAKLRIPPVNGMVYTVAVGDTPEKLAELYKSNADKIIAFNDAELSGMKAGDIIVIPDAVKPQPRVVAATSVGSFFRPNYGFNGYFYGYCTWYVANRVSVPNNWRNADRWDDNARLSPGWIVSRTPVVGAVAQTSSRRYGPGHVGVVEAVSADGSQIKYSDMNGISGWGRVGYSDWVPTYSTFEYFIYRI